DLFLPLGDDDWRLGVQQARDGGRGDVQMGRAAGRGLVLDGPVLPVPSSGAGALGLEPAVVQGLAGRVEVREEDAGPARQRGPTVQHFRDPFAGVGPVEPGGGRDGCGDVGLLQVGDDPGRSVRGPLVASGDGADAALEAGEVVWYLVHGGDSGAGSVWGTGRPCFISPPLPPIGGPRKPAPGPAHPNGPPSPPLRRSTPPA